MIKLFDPWKGGFCTCLPKYTLNPYTGCNHRCLYCYITSYIKDAFRLRLKRINFKGLEKKIKGLKKDIPFSLSNSSDPYPLVEEKLGITRKVLEILKKDGFKVSIITKSALVLKDLDIMKDMKATISFTITTPDDEMARKLEPHAPPPSMRINAIKEISRYNIPVCLRIDPVIPFVNDKIDVIDDFLKEVSPYIKMVSVSTYKARPDNFKRLSGMFKEVKRIKFEKKKIRGYRYIEREIRHGILLKIKEVVKNHNLKFGLCREGFDDLKDTLSCDPIFEHFE